MPANRSQPPHLQKFQDDVDASKVQGFYLISSFHWPILCLHPATIEFDRASDQEKILAIIHNSMIDEQSMLQSWLKLTSTMRGKFIFHLHLHCASRNQSPTEEAKE